MPERILIIDDKQSIVEILETTLGAEGYEISSANTGEAGLRLLEAGKHDLVLCDVRLPDIDGLEILKSAMSGALPPAVIMITAYGSIQNAIESMKLGAVDYVTKPFNLDEIKEVVRKNLEHVRLRKENIELRAELERRYDFSGIIGKSKLMMEVLDKVRRVAPSTASVLITGETGVGKELVARAIHHNSPRAGGRFIALNCAAIPESLLESELFGHVRGAFTGAIAEKRGMFEEADGGTLLLDEIAELHQSLQAKLLRTLDENSVRRVGGTNNISVDVRLICSTNKKLSAEVEQKRFRLDLYHRIKVVEIHIPALRERREDIMPLAEHFLRRLCAEHGKNITGIAPDAVNAMLAHEWVGNVRELVNVLEQAILMAEDEVIRAANLPSLGGAAADGVLPDDVMNEPSLKSMLGRVEKEIIARILGMTGGNRRETARKLGLSERALYYKLDEHGLK